MSAAALVQRAQAAGVTLSLVDGKIKYAGLSSAVKPLIEPLRQHKADLVRWFTQTPANDPSPPIESTDWIELAKAYQAHHINCPSCKSAGRGSRYGLRCGVGSALWTTYQSSN